MKFENVKPLQIEKYLFKNIFFNYPNAEQASLKDISLEISAHTTVGLVGSTGSGKTTTADIILGLLDPQSGTLEVDGNVINNKNKKSCKRLLDMFLNIFICLTIV